MEEKRIDVTNLTLDDLQDEYEKLFERHMHLRKVSEADTQRIYELKRSLDTASAAEAYLAQELEQFTNAAPSSSQNAAHKKTQYELEELRRKQSSLGAEYATLQQENETLTDENVQLRSQLEGMVSSRRRSIAADTKDTNNEHLQRLQQLEQDNFELLIKLEEFQENCIRFTMAIAEREKNVEVLRDQVNCLEENMRFKREELEEKTQLLESAQDQLTEANAKIAMLTTAPENNDRKGNSLFAEVDDQRQAMKQVLAAQKKSYLQMKKVFNESEYEIRRLKRENTAMHTELQACSSIFCNADKTYQDKLNDRIRHLLNQNDELERKLNWTQERLKELAGEKGVQWLDSMLNFCKKETDELKKQLHSVRIQKASLEEQLRNAQQEMARWRFESLKSRCILLDREDLLNEHKIVYKAINVMEFDITQKQLEMARPRIVNVTAADMNSNENEKSQIPKEHQRIICPVLKENTTNDNNFKSIDLTTPLKPPKSITPPKISMSNASLPEKVEVIMDESNKENVCDASLDIANAPTTNEVSKECTQHNELQSITVKSFAAESKLKKVPPHSSTIAGPSILCKQRDIFVNQKNVKFCNNADTVHNLSPEHFVSESNIAVNINNAGDINDKSNKTTVKQIRTKSNIIVRRVVVSSKQSNS